MEIGNHIIIIKGSHKTFVVYCANRIHFDPVAISHGAQYNFICYENDKILFYYLFVFFFSSRKRVEYIFNYTKKHSVL